jgi:hypothetical protein
MVTYVKFGISISNDGASADISQIVGSISTSKISEAVNFICESLVNDAKSSIEGFDIYNFALSADVVIAVSRVQDPETKSFTTSFSIIEVVFD